MDYHCGPFQLGIPGIGNYTYGSQKEDSSEAGLYRHSFTIPSSWLKKEVFIVFDGSVTDTEVKTNGALAGPVHQGAFYRFKYNITALLKPGAENLLEVKANKVSSNELVNEAERTADDILYITAKDLYGRQLNTCSWCITTPREMTKRFLLKGTGAVEAKEADGKITLQANGVHVKIDSKTGLLLEAGNGRGPVSLSNGPVLISGETTLPAVSHYDSLGTHAVKTVCEGKQHFVFAWTMLPSGVLKLAYQYCRKTAKKCWALHSITRKKK